MVWITGKCVGTEHVGNGRPLGVAGSPPGCQFSFFFSSSLIPIFSPGSNLETQLQLPKLGGRELLSFLSVSLEPYWLPQVGNFSTNSMWIPQSWGFAPCHPEIPLISLRGQARTTTIGVWDYPGKPAVSCGGIGVESQEKLAGTTY